MVSEHGTWGWSRNVAPEDGLRTWHL